MKKTVLLFAVLMMSFMGYTQTATGFNYKALVANNGTPLANAIINVRATFKAGTSTVKWRETHSNVHTDANGIFSITLGQGTRNAGVPSFDKMDWNVGNMNLTIEVDSGSGYQTLVSNEYFKTVPYAKQAERLRPGYYGVQIKNTTSDSGHGLQVVNRGTGSLYEGIQLSHGNDDWYLIMRNNKDFSIANDGINVLKISDTDDSVWLKGQLKLTKKGLKIDSYSSTSNSYSIKSTSDGLAFNYNAGTAMRMHGTASVEVTGKLVAPASGNNDMKAYAYGEWYGGSPRHFSSNVTITRTGAGQYNVAFNPSVGGVSDYIVIVSRYAEKGLIQYGKGTDHFTVDLYSASHPNTLVDGNFTFVVYKK